MRRPAIALAALVGATALAGCGSGREWEALPLDNHDHCFQIQRHEYGALSGHRWALGIYCKEDLR